MFLGFSTASFSQNSVSIGTTSTNPKAVLWLSGTNQGIIIPIVTNKTNVSAGPTEKGMVVFDDSDKKVYFFDGTAWNQVGGSGAGGQGITINGNTVQLNSTVGSTFSLSNTAPTGKGQLLVWDGTKWDATLAPTTTGQTLSWDNTNGKWTLANATLTLAGDVSGPSNNTTIATTSGNNILAAVNNAATTSKLLPSQITAGTPGQVLTTSAGSVAIWANLPAATGTVTSIATGTGLTGGPITTTGTIALANTSVVAATYGSATQVPQIAVDAQGRITTASNITIPASGPSTSGLLSTTDWNRFNNKLGGSLTNGNVFVGNVSNVATGVPMSGDALLSNTGVLTIQPSKITSSKILDGEIVDADINAAANISDTKLAIISTAGKVSGNAITTGTIGGNTIINTTGNVTATNLSGNGSALTNLNASNLATGTVPTARIDVGTTANKIVQLDGTGKLPAIDGSQLTNLPAGTETDPIVKAINGIVKSNGTTISAAAAGTDYQAPLVSGTNIKTINGTSVLGAGNITAVTTETDPAVKAINGLVKSDGTTIAAVVSGTDIKTINGTSLLGAGNITAVTSETDPAVKAINGLVKSNGTTISAATAGTDYLAPNGNGSALTNLNASNLATGTVPTARIDVGTTANKIVQLDGTGKLPAVDGSQLTNLPAGTETDPTVKAINGLVKSNGTTIAAAVAGTDYVAIETDPAVKAINGLVKSNGATISAATAGTDYLAPNGNASALTNLNASNISSGTLAIANGGTGATTAPAARTALGLGTLATLSTVTTTEITDGTIVDADIATGAGIVDTKLATITTAGKVSGNAITSGIIGGNTVINSTGNITTTGTLNTGAATVSGLTIGSTVVNWPTNASGSLTNDGTGNLTWVPAGGSGTVTSITKGVGIVPGAAITTSGTIDVNVGTGANQIVQLDGSGKLPAVDGSQLINLPGGTETDPTVKAINGLVKSNGTTISAATAGTDYQSPLVSGTNIKTINGTSVLGAGNITAVTTETDPAVKAINGLVKSDGTTIGAVVSGTDVKTINGTSILGAGNITTLTTVTTAEITDGTIGIADLNPAAGILTNGSSPNSVGDIVGDFASGLTLQNNAPTGANIANVLNTNGAYNLTTTGTLSTGPATVTGLTIGTSVWPINASGSLTNDGTGNLTWVPSGGSGTVTSVGAGTGLVGGPITTSGSLSVDVGTTANKIVQLDGTGKLPAVDGSQLTNLPAGTETDPTVKAINGLVKSNGTTISAATAGTDYVATETDPAVKAINGLVKSNGTTIGAVVSGTDIKTINGTSILGAGNITTLTTVTSADITDGTIVDADINGTANINGAKINPTFGAQAVSTTSTLTTGSAGQFVVDATGNITKIRNVTTSFPAAQGAANSVLTNDGAGNLTWATGSGWGLSGNAGTTPATQFIGTTDAQDLVFRTNNTEFARLTSAGKLGIGTNSPNGLLEVLNSSSSGNAATFNVTNAANNGASVFANKNGTTGAAYQAIVTGGAEGLNINQNGTGYGIDVLVSNPLSANSSIIASHNGIGSVITANAQGTGTAASLAVTNPASPATALTVATSGTGPAATFSGGNVGIGTTTPAAKLDIAGNIKIADGTQGLGKVLTSDATGLASWQAISGTGTVTSVVTGTGLTGGPITSSGTIAVDVGTTANKIVQLDGTGKLPAIDGSQLTNLPAGTETDPTVKAINGLVKSNGITISAAAAGTDYQAPLVSGTNIKTINGTSVLGAGNITAVTTETDPTVKAINGLVKSDGTTIGAVVSGTDVKTINGTSILGAGNITALTTETDPSVKAINGLVKSDGTTIGAVVSGTDVKTINGTSILGAGNITALTTETDPAVKAINGLVKSDGTTIGAVVSGTDVKTINGASILGAGNITALTTVTSADITDGTIVDADINGTANINGAKINPAFGAQAVSTTSTLTTGSAGQFVVDATGNITKVNNITTSFPASQGAANTVLTNDGAGNLTWAASSGWGLNGNATTIGNKLGTTNGNPLTFITSNTDRMTIDATGNIGIGTTTPNEKLDVAGNIRINSNDIYLFNVNGDFNHGLGWYGAGKLFNSQLINGPILYGWDGGALGSRQGSENIALRWTTAGNVGIGNIAPTEKLDVTGNLKFSGALMPNNLPGTAGEVLTSAGPGLPPTWSAGSTTTASNGITKTGNDFSLGGALTGETQINRAGSNFIIYGAGNFSVRPGGSGTERLFVDGATGNVGIGTIGPSQALSVNGGLIVDHGGTNAGTFTQSQVLQFGTGSGEGIGSNRTPGLKSLDFYTNASKRMTISQTGNVGISTANPPLTPLQIGDNLGLMVLGSDDVIAHGIYFDGTNLINRSGNANSAILLGDGKAGIYTFPAGAAAGVAASPNMRFNVRPTGVGIQVDNPIETFQVNGATYLNPITAPVITTDRLYNVGGNLFWNGTNISSGGSGWSSTGNAGTNSNTNFIGTTDNVALRFKTNNTASGLIDPITSNAFFGYRAGEVATGGQNVAMGANALLANTSGTGNVAIGTGALQTNASGTGNIAIGNFADISSPGLINSIAIGRNAIVGASNSMVLGGTGGDAVNVGIGTTSPTSALDVVAVNKSGIKVTTNSLLPGEYAVSAIRTGDGDVTGFFWNNNPASGANAHGVYGQADGAGSGVFGSNNGTTGNAATFMNLNAGNTNPVVKIFNNGTGPALATTGGNVGIGTLLPLSKLQVGAGNIQLDGEHSLLAYDPTDVFSFQSKNVPQYSMGWYQDSETPTLASAWFSSYAGFRLFTNGTQAMRISQFGNVSIGATSAATTAALDIQSTSKGLLIPRLTTAQRDAIPTPDLGLMIYNTSTSAFNYYNGGSWVPVGGGSGWGLTGTAGTVDGTNFIGTTDNVPLNFKVNNQKAGRVDATGSVFLGYQSGNFNTATDNVGIGFEAVRSSSGTSNTAIGYRALRTNTTGQQNTSVGAASLQSNTLGSFNIAHGAGSLNSNTTGDNNTGIGYLSLTTNTTGSNNTALGYGADVTTPGLTKATAIGYNAKVAASNSLVLGGTGVDAVNVGIGTTIPSSKLHISGTTSGVSRAAGTLLDVNTTITDSYSYMRFSQDVLQNPVFVGVDFDNGISEFWNEDPLDMRFGTSNAERLRITSAGNVGIGTSTPGAGLDLLSSNGMRINNWLSTGASVGGGAYVGTNLYRNLSDNVWKYTNTHGSIGGAAIQFNGNGGGGTENDILFVNTTTPGTANGNATVNETMRIKGGSGWVGVGISAPVSPFDVRSTHNGATVHSYNNSTGGSAVGVYGRSDGYVGVWGDATGTTTIGVLGTTVASYGVYGSSTTGTGVYGNSSSGYAVYAAGIAGGTTAWFGTSDRRLKKNIQTLPNALSNIMKMRGVSFDWRGDEFPELNLSNKHDIGVIAQEIKEVYPEVVNTPADGYYSVSYATLVPVLIEGIKEQQKMIEDQKKMIDSLQIADTENKRKIALLEASLNKVATSESELASLKSEIEKIKAALGLTVDAALPKKEEKK